MNHKQHIDALHDIMHTAKDLGDIVNYFLDNLGEDPSFLEKGERAKDHEMLDDILEQAMKKILGKKTKVHLCLMQVNHKNFMHGIGYADGKTFTLLYFRDSMIGVLVLPETTSETMIFRLKGAVVPQGDKIFMPFRASI